MSFSLVAAKIFQGLGPKRREFSNGDQVYSRCSYTCIHIHKYSFAYINVYSYTCSNNNHTIHGAWGKLLLKLSLKFQSAQFDLRPAQLYSCTAVVLREQLPEPDYIRRSSLIIVT